MGETAYLEAVANIADEIGLKESDFPPPSLNPVGARSKGSIWAFTPNRKGTKKPHERRFHDHLLPKRLLRLGSGEDQAHT